MRRKTAVVVVTYNRRDLLSICLHALLEQTEQPAFIVVVNNNSTDGTGEFLKVISQNNKAIQWLSLTENEGGAGGFYEGMKYAIEKGADWIWMMDDDANPTPDALAKLLQIVDKTGDIYASLAIEGKKTSWEMAVKQHDSWLTTHNPSDISEKAEVRSLPFLGFLIHRNLVDKIGLPDKGFFIAADDTEYCLRAQQAGSRLFLAGKSLIEHPMAQYHKYRILSKEINYVSLPPWKRYYDTRNRIFIAKKYFGLRLYTQTLPSILFRALITLCSEKSKYKQLKAYIAGISDGLLSKGGKRHEQRGLK